MIAARISILIAVLTFSSSTLWAHARLTSPTPRSNSASIKSGPCGGLARSVSPMVVQGGQLLNVTWEETINHPGKYLFALSLANDTDFQAHPLATVIDTQNTAANPVHVYNTSIAIPNINCDSCTIQMIQSMEENPSAPTYYYSCADIKIVASAAPPITPPTDSPVQRQEVSNNTSNSPKMAGCGLIKNESPPPPPSMKFLGLIAFLMLFPLTLLITLRRQSD